MTGRHWSCQFYSSLLRPSKKTSSRPWGFEYPCYRAWRLRPILSSWRLTKMQRNSRMQRAALPLRDIRWRSMKMGLSSLEVVLWEPGGGRVLWSRRLWSVTIWVYRMVLALMRQDGLLVESWYVCLWFRHASQLLMLKSLMPAAIIILPSSW